MTARPWENWTTEPAYLERMKQRATDPGFEMEQTKQLVRLLTPWMPGDASVLDVGCGVGHFYPSLRRIAPNIRYTGIDITPAYIEAAQTIFAGEDARFELGDVYDLRFPDCSFDVVLVYMILPFLPDYQEPVRQAARVTRRRLYMRLLLGEEEYLIKRYKPDGTFFYYNIYEVNKLCETVRGAGFHEVLVHDDEFNADLPRQADPHSTYTINTPSGKLQISGNLVMTWKTVEAIRDGEEG